MELLDIGKLKNRNLLITAKTAFCSLIFQILVSYVGLKITYCELLEKYKSRIFATYPLAYIFKVKESQLIRQIHVIF